jgi:hypothetical protein
MDATTPRELGLRSTSRRLSVLSGLERVGVDEDVQGFVDDGLLAQFESDVGVRDGRLGHVGLADHWERPGQGFSHLGHRLHAVHFQTRGRGPHCRSPPSRIPYGRD